MMTQKHFIALAAALAATRPASGSPAFAITQWLYDVHAVADVCAEDNPRFNREKFYQACGIPE